MKENPKAILPKILHRRALEGGYVHIIGVSEGYHTRWQKMCFGLLILLGVVLFILPLGPSAWAATAFLRARAGWKTSRPPWDRRAWARDEPRSSRTAVSPVRDGGKKYGGNRPWDESMGRRGDEHHDGNALRVWANTDQSYSSTSLLIRNRDPDPGYIYY